ncbi:MAG: BcsR/BcsP family cellulose biosynthesis protein [Gallionella sp.]|jgi:hypothetical protein
MSQQANADIRNLFKKFGGETANYQEIQQTYVADKAAQSWPIVEAMERSRPAAPIRKAVSARLPVAAAPVRSGLFAAAPVSASIFQSAPVSPAQPVAPVVPPAPVEVKSTGLGLFSRPQVLPAAPVVTEPVVKAATSPLHSIFGALKLTVAEPPPPEPPASFVVQNQSLDAVFSRLLNSQNSGAPAEPDGSLRGLFGFLKK